MPVFSISASTSLTFTKMFYKILKIKKYELFCFKSMSESLINESLSTDVLFDFAIILHYHLFFRLFPFFWVDFIPFYVSVNCVISLQLMIIITSIFSLVGSPLYLNILSFTSENIERISSFFISSFSIDFCLKLSIVLLEI